MRDDANNEIEFLPSGDWRPYKAAIETTIDLDDDLPEDDAKAIDSSAVPTEDEFQVDWRPAAAPSASDVIVLDDSGSEEEAIEDSTLNGQTSSSSCESAATTVVDTAQDDRQSARVDEKNANKRRAPSTSSTDAPSPKRAASANDERLKTDSPHIFHM